MRHSNRIGGAGRVVASASLLLALLVSVVAADTQSRPADAAAGADWPHWRGTGSDGTAAAGGVFTDGFRLRARWRRELGSGYSGVVVADGRAVTLFSDGERDHVIALDAATGEEAWRVDLGATWPGREGAVDGPVSTPAIDGGVVFALGPRGNLVAVGLTDGKTVWQRDLVAALGAAIPHWGFGTSPIVAGGRLIVATGGEDGRIVTAFDPATGEVAWSAGKGSGGVRYQSPMATRLGGRLQVVAASDTTLLGLDPATGRILWSHEHGGERFFSGIVNPVAAGGGQLLLTHRPDEAEMLSVDEGADGGAVRSEWTTPNLKGNYATPVEHDGYLYGFNGSYLSCVDAATGELAWKSRPPGNGWLILVDGHLVVVTKAGTLHVVRASPEGYEESASLPAFERLVWTPPSFAGGLIFGRDSFSRVAAFEVVGGGQQEAVVGSGAAPASSDFLRWVDGLGQSPDRAERVRKFLEDNPTSPVIEGDRLAHIVYLGAASDDLAVRGDMLNLAEERQMKRVALGPAADDGALFYASFELQPDARLSYQLVRNLTDTLADPRNPRAAGSFALAGPASQILMPKALPIADPPTDGPEPRLEKFQVSSETTRVGSRTWGGTRDVHVYLPPGYDDTDRRYPTVIVQYGAFFLENTSLARALDTAIGRSMQPVIVAFVQNISAYEYARSQRGVHARMLVTQLIPEIDARYRTLAQPQHRVLVGADEAGYSALFAALRYSHVFGNAIVQSPLPIGPGARQLLDTIELLPGEPVRVLVDWGSYAPVDPRDGTDVPAFSRRLRDTLAANGYDVESWESNDGSNMQLLAERVMRALEAWFPVD